MRDCRIGSYQRNSLGPRRGPREAVDVPEEGKKDKRLDELIAVHEHRLFQLERERQEARAEWREVRYSLREMNGRSKKAFEDTREYWEKKRAGFFSMVITSGEFRKAKSVYERLKQEAMQLRLKARETVPECRTAKERFFATAQKLIVERLHIEKLKIMRDEILRQAADKEQ